ncbi:MAG: class I SAM-dependent methyltransferase [Acidobacteriota bacterium]|jgi:SAM-dependent methyltransferase|nr:class I SAM-dependent methyltransferase [Acidobacteriota bacterium]
MSDKTIIRFDNRVENYVKYRPHYPLEVLEFFRDELNLKKSSVIADIGSGTGISSKLFLENGNKVFGIEPNKLMREASVEYLKDYPNFKVIDGTSENTTLEDKYVDFIIAAQAFHWFNPAKTLTEFRRILRKNAFVSLIWNERQLDTNKFLRDYENLLTEFGSDYENVRHDKITKKSLNEFFKTNIYRKTFENSQTLDFNGLLGRLLSSSYMPSEENPLFEEMKKSLKQLFAEHARKGKIKVLYNTNIFYTKL